MASTSRGFGADSGPVGFDSQAQRKRESTADMGLQAHTLRMAAEDEPRADHASYLASWLEVLSNDKRFIFSAAAHAQRAVTYLHDLQPKPAEIDQAA